MVYPGYTFDFIYSYYYFSYLLGRLDSYERLLGGIERNQSGHIVKAKSLQNFWMVNVDYAQVDMDLIGNMAGTADWVRFISLFLQKLVIMHIVGICRGV